MNLFQYGNFLLNSGKKSKFKINCDALTSKDIKTIAWMIKELVDPFSSVEGIPKGGIRLAKELKKYISESNDTHLIVDDVLTTGNSMAKAKLGYEQNIIGAVIFARGPCLDWIKPLWSLPEELWKL